MVYSYFATLYINFNCLFAVNEFHRIYIICKKFYVVFVEQKPS